MVIRTFNVDDAIYQEYIAYCKKNGISMSKRIEQFIKEDLARITKEPERVRPSAKSVSSDHFMKKYC